MADCCRAEPPRAEPSLRCVACERPGKKVDLITVKALLRPEALARLAGSGHRFCDTPGCRIVYFAEGEAFSVDDLSAPVFQKEPAGNRTVCYCFAIGEAELRRDIEGKGASTAPARVTAHVKAGRCACEIKNPQGSCCLGNLRSVVGDIGAGLASRRLDRKE